MEHLFQGRKYLEANPVEAEMKITPAVLSLFTTSNGFIGALFPKRPMPAWLKAAFPKNKTLKDIPWDALSNEQKTRLLTDAGADRATYTDFFKDRSIPGLVVRNRVKVGNPDQLPAVLQPYYKASTGELSTKEWALPYVEWTSPAAMKEGSNVELHFAFDDPDPAVAVDTTWATQRALGIEESPLHVHVLSEIPVDAINANPWVSTMAMVQYFRVQNLLSEFFYIKNGHRIRTVKDDPRSITFGSTSRAQVEVLTRGLFDYAQTGDVSAVPRLKPFMGFAWGTYQNKNLWGSEARIVDPQHNRAELYHMLQDIRLKTLDESLGITSEDFVDWMNESVRVYGPALNFDLRNQDDKIKLMSFVSAQTWYGVREPLLRTPKTIPSSDLSRMKMAYEEVDSTTWIAEVKKRDPNHPDVPKDLRDESPHYLMMKPEWESLLKEFNEIEMLLTAWHMDPMAFRNPKFNEDLVLSAQMEGLRKVEDTIKKFGGAYYKPEFVRAINNIMKEFLINSKIEDVFHRHN